MEIRECMREYIVLAQLGATAWPTLLVTFCLHGDVFSCPCIGKLSLPTTVSIALCSIVIVALFDTLDFLLNEYFNELNTASFNILNKFFN